MRIAASLVVLLFTLTPALADEPPAAAGGAPWAAIAIFAVVIGMMAGILIWRRRR